MRVNEAELLILLTKLKEQVEAMSTAAEKEGRYFCEEECARYDSLVDDIDWVHRKIVAVEAVEETKEKEHDA